MGRLEQFTTEKIKKGGRLSQLEIKPSVLPITKPADRPGIFRRTAGDIKALATDEISIRDVAREIPETTAKMAKGFVNTFIPAISNFFKTTGSIFGEGLAYAVDKDVRTQYKAGNLEILPTITETTTSDVAKTTIAAGIEIAVYRSFPNIIKMKIAARGGAGALQGVGFAISEGLATDKSPEEIVKSLPIFGVMGGVVGVITPYILPLLKAEMKALPKEMKNVFKGLKKEIRPLKAKKLTVKGTEEATKVPISTPNKKYEAYLRSQGYEPYIPTEKLPEFQMGRLKGITKTLPEIQIGEPLAKPVSKIKPVVKPAPLIAKTKPIAKIAKELEIIPLDDAGKPIIEKRVSAVSREVLPVGEGKVRVSRLETRVKGILDDITPEKAEDAGISTYKQMNKKEQIRLASEFVDKNPDDAMAILRGDKPAPKDLLHNSIAIALEKKAEMGADANLAVKLGSLRSSRAGQEISILTEADPSNPITKIAEIIKARMARAERKLKRGQTVATAKRTIQKEVSTVIKKTQLKISEAERLLAEIVC